MSAPILLLAGLVLTVMSANLVVSLAKLFGKKSKISPLFMALIVLALGTNLPELTVLLTSLFEGASELAIANSVGSSITNIGFIFGLSLLFHPPRFGTKNTPKNALYLLITTLTFTLLYTLPLPGFVRGLILMMLASSIMFIQYRQAKASPWHVERRLHKVAHPPQEVRRLESLPNWVSIGLFIAGLLGLFVGGQLVVFGSLQLAQAWGVSQGLIGLTIVSISTTLPELMTLIMATLQREDKLVTGTIVGSNVYNMGLFAGLASFWSPHYPLTVVQNLLLVGMTALLTGLVLFYVGRRPHRIWGAVLFGLYIIFMLQTLAVQ